MRNLVVLGALLASLWLVPAALGADKSLLSGYAGNASSPVVRVQGATPPKAQVAGGTLPFSGLDVVWFTVAGSALVLVGLGVRRLGSQKN